MLTGTLGVAADAVGLLAVVVLREALGVALGGAIELTGGVLATVEFDVDVR